MVLPPHSHIPHSTTLPSGASLRPMAARKRRPIGPPQGEKSAMSLASISAFSNSEYNPMSQCRNLQYNKEPPNPQQRSQIPRGHRTFLRTSRIVNCYLLSNSQSCHIVPRNSADGPTSPSSANRAASVASRASLAPCRFSTFFALPASRSAVSRSANGPCVETSVFPHPILF